MLPGLVVNPRPIKFQQVIPGNKILATRQQKYHFYQIFYDEALPGVLGIQGEGLFIFRDLGRRAVYFQGFGELLEF